MIDKSHMLSVVMQCRLLDLNRSTVYYRRKTPGQSELDLMRRIDELHLKYPFMGSRQMRDMLRGEGFAVNRKRVQRLMRTMGLVALYPRRRTSIPNKDHEIYPYLLRGLEITRARQVYAADITYIPMAKGFLYLVAVIDWHSRMVLSWRLSNTLESDFCVEALREAFALYGTPEIFNTDQGSQFTSKDFTDVLKEHHVAISMDGKGRWMDNVFVERLWRSLKYEEVYLKAYETVAEAGEEIGTYFEFFNTKRSHTSLGRKTPAAVFFGEQDTALAA